MSTRADELAYYATPGPMTDLGDCLEPVTADRCSDPLGLCRRVQGLLVHEMLVALYGVDPPRERMDRELQLRSAASMVEAITRLDPSPLSTARPAGRRLVGNCRHFTVLSCALLRHHGVAARARCGFADYFERGRYVDHWLTELWREEEGRWVRVDVELDPVVTEAFAIGFDPEDVPPGRFLSGAEAWLRCARGDADPDRFGIFDMWGRWFVQGNVVRDLAALNKEEMLPWDDWGVMGPSPPPEPVVTQLTDRAAAVAAAGSWAEVVDLYAAEDQLRVPPVVRDARFELDVALASLPGFSAR